MPMSLEQILSEAQILPDESKVIFADRRRGGKGALDGN